MHKEYILDKARGCLMGVAVGDALGMPVETLSREKIREVTGGAGITDFVAPLTNREWVKGLKAGDTTDDWQLTAVVARSLIRRGRFDIEDIAAEHVRALAESTFGWGKTTQRAIEEIRDGERSPRERAGNFGPKSGAGNGVIMKVAPLALHHSIHGVRFTRDMLLSDILHLGWLTHHDGRASTTAYCVARLMGSLFYNPARTSERIRTHLHWFLHERASPDSDTREAFDKLSVLLEPSTTESSEALVAAVGNGFHCLETLGFAIGTFMRHPTDFRAGVLEAVNAGGDTDTNASIVGALIGMNCGLSAIPEEWQNFNPAFQEALTLAEQLCT